MLHGSFLNVNCMKVWMAGDFLQLNADKTEVLFSAPEHVVSNVMRSLGFCPLLLNLPCVTLRLSG